MDHAQEKCPICSRTFSPADTVVFGYGHMAHLDCGRPRAMSPEERVLLVNYCRGHPVGDCVTCGRRYHLTELGSDTVGRRTHLCPQCRHDLTDNIRTHLDGCAMLPEEVRRRAQAACEAARNLVKRTHQLRDADVLVQEAEAALDELREAMRQSARVTDALPLPQPPPR